MWRNDNKQIIDATHLKICYAQVISDSRSVGLYTEGWGTITIYNLCEKF